ncbi:MAG: LysR family transcriptional regulator, partial [Erysipelotrichaceae bacterium]|nr:LysR family transcriptional regulator [Erysipelotrichaceae bacterium]
RPVIKVAYTKEKIFFDARIALLLGLIHEFRSVAKACQAMQISYTAGWNMIRQIEAQADCPLVLRNMGGAKGSHSELTKEGRQLLDSFTRFESELSKDADDLFIKHLPDFLKQE